MFKNNIEDHLLSKTTWGGILMSGLAIYAFFEGRIEWQAMTESLAMGFAIIGISDRMD